MHFLGSDSQFVVELLIDEVDIARVYEGQKVLLVLNAYGDEVFEAKISKISPKMNERSQTFMVEANFVTRPDVLYAGLWGEANIVIVTKENALTIPVDYLQKPKSGADRKRVGGSRSGLEELRFCGNTFWTGYNRCTNQTRMKYSVIAGIAKTHLLSRMKQTVIAALGVTFGIGTFITLVSFMTGLNGFLDGLILNRTPHVHLFNEVEPTENQPVDLFAPFQDAVNIVHSINPKENQLRIRNALPILNDLQKDPDVKGAIGQVSAQGVLSIRFHKTKW